MKFKYCVRNFKGKFLTYKSTKESERKFFNDNSNNNQHNSTELQYQNLKSYIFEIITIKIKKFLFSLAAEAASAVVEVLHNP